VSDSLIAQLNAAGVTCRALASWCKCRDGRADLCESCYLGDPGECDEQVIEVLVKHVVNATGHVDEVLDQRDYWKTIADRMCNLVMGREQEAEDE
jgi:hypothetical protein